MFELKGKHLTSRYYARKIPFFSMSLYEMSRVEKSSFWYHTVPFPTRLIPLEGEFTDGYTRRLHKYMRQAESMDLEIRQPEYISDLHDIYQSVQEGKNLNPLPEGYLKRQENYYYSEVYHPELGRLAAHVSIGDREEMTVFGMINASDFRSYESKKNQRICSIGNKYLFHRDMVHFQSLGYQYYDMVGIREPMNQMKKEFGGEIVMTYSHVPWPVYLLKKLVGALRT